MEEPLSEWVDGNAVLVKREVAERCKVNVAEAEGDVGLVVDVGESGDVVVGDVVAPAVESGLDDEVACVGEDWPMY